jgi:NAD(P)H-nitrite reductase large subunit
MKYVIIGNSTAAIGCVEGIRSIDKCGEIIIISKESQHTYSRPLISYYLEGKTDLERIKYRPDSFYIDNKIEVMTGREADTIDSKKKIVRLSDAEQIGYDKLLIATGSSPFIPTIKGLEDVRNKFTFMSLDDALQLEKSINENSRVLIIGAGLIGIKCAEGVLKRVNSVTVVDMADRILPNVLDNESAKMVQYWLEKKGMQFRLNDSVSQFNGNYALLNSGETVKFDIAVIAVGVRPNTKLFCDFDSNAKYGISTNDLQRTKLEDIYAAGDCTVSLDISTGKSKTLALLPNAYMQGECAGINMAGGNKLYQNAIPMNSTKLFGLPIITAGSYEGEEFIVRGEGFYKKLVSKDNLLKGFILIGNVERAGIYTSLIREQVPLDSIDYGLIKEKPQLMAFSKTERIKKLGGI